MLIDVYLPDTCIHLVFTFELIEGELKQPCYVLTTLASLRQKLQKIAPDVSS